MYLASIGGLSSGWYWSSSEYGADLAWEILFSGYNITWSGKFYNDNVRPIRAFTVGTAAEPVWVRTMPMTCYQVWINEDNNFQFIFWYPYKNNNFVKIYDMEGNMVFETDLPYHDPNLIVDLPDGMYMVKTFNDDPETPLQEFMIGKP